MVCLRCQLIFLVSCVAQSLLISSEASKSSSGSSMSSSLLHTGARQSDEPGKSFAQMMCANSEAPRHAAVCFSGSARSFPHQLVRQSMKENLLGGSFGVKMRPFLHVARIDKRGDVFHGAEHDVFPEWSEDHIRETATFLNIADEDIKIIDGPDVPLPNCSNYKADFEHRKDFEAKALANEAKDNQRNTLSYVNSLAGQLTHRKGCMDLISASERKYNLKYDLIIQARADLTYYLPLKPYCLYNLNEAVPNATLPGRRYWDWFFMLPRDVAEVFFVKRYTDFYGCKRPLANGDSVEDYLQYKKVGEGVPSLSMILTRRPHTRNSVCYKGAMNIDGRDLSGDCHDSYIEKNKFNHAPWSWTT